MVILLLVELFFAKRRRERLTALLAQSKLCLSGGTKRNFVAGNRFAVLGATDRLL
jgi:hypothetical protein